MKATVACLAVALATPALAQDSGWSFALSPYSWTPGLTSSAETAWGVRSAARSPRHQRWAAAVLHLSPQWHLGAGVMYSRLVGDSADSPITV